MTLVLLFILFFSASKTVLVISNKTEAIMTNES